MCFNWQNWGQWSLAGHLDVMLMRVCQEATRQGEQICPCRAVVPGKSHSTYPPFTCQYLLLEDSNMLTCGVKYDLSGFSSTSQFIAGRRNRGKMQIFRWDIMMGFGVVVRKEGSQLIMNTQREGNWMNYTTISIFIFIGCEKANILDYIDGWRTRQKYQAGARASTVRQHRANLKRC